MNKPIQIDDKLINDTLAYLRTCPYSHVDGILGRWKALIAGPNAPGMEPEKKPKKPE